MKLEDIGNFILIENNLVHIDFELNREQPSYFRIAKEAHHALYRSMVEALRGTANISITGRRDKDRIYKYKLGNNPWMEIRKTNVAGCKSAWRFSEPIQCDEPQIQNESIEKSAHDDFLIGFFDALAMIQTECFMSKYVHSRPLNVHDNEIAILEWLHEDIRNEFEHFVPKLYTAAVSDLSQASVLCLRLIQELLFESGNVIHHSSPDGLKNLIREVSSKLGSS